MRRLGDKIGAKLLAEQAERAGGAVERRPGRDARRGRAATPSAIGYPLMIKATAGGGGRGIRRVDDADGLRRGVRERPRRRALKAFGDPTVFMERVVTGARHVEVQIIADSHGTVWAVGVRDCSMQRRNQKVIEESHCIALTPEQDRDLRAAAVRLAAARRLRQRRHGRVPLPAGRAALRVPRGQHPAPGRASGHRADDRARPRQAAAPRRRAAAAWRASRRRPTGYAIEARLNAEDPQRGVRAGAGHDRDADAAGRARHPRRHRRRRGRRDPARVRLDDRQGHRPRPRPRRGAGPPAPGAVAD